jgi:hypothetical protein
VASVDLATELDHMGAPLTSSDGDPTWTQTVEPDGAVTWRWVDTSVTGSWRPYWYRAVAWSADDPLVGQVGARSPGSAAQSVTLPPSTAPAVSPLRVEPMSTAQATLVSWVTNAPVAPTPRGPHALTITARTAQGPFVQMLATTSTAPYLASAGQIPPLTTPGGRVYRVASPTDTPAYRYYAWLPRPSGKYLVAVRVTDPLGRSNETISEVA